MPTLAELLPEFVEELATALRAESRLDLAEQLAEVEVASWHHHELERAASIWLRSPRPLNAVERNIIGVKHGETVPVEHPRWVALDTDNFGRLASIELLDPGDIPARLGARLPPSP